MACYMDDPAENWPYWKFGFEQEDLYTTLYKQYNTISFGLQDPEAFHHDVSDIAEQAKTRAQFEDMLRERRELRQRELNEALEETALQLIGKPSLFKQRNDEQWYLAMLLFRFESLDSLIRYFASFVTFEDQSPRIRRREAAYAEQPEPLPTEQPRSGSLSPLPNPNVKTRTLWSIINEVDEERPQELETPQHQKEQHKRCEPDQQHPQQQPSPQDSLLDSAPLDPGPTIHSKSERPNLQPSRRSKRQPRTSTTRQHSERKGLRYSPRIARQKEVREGRIQKPQGKNGKAPQSSKVTRKRFANR